MTIPEAAQLVIQAGAMAKAAKSSYWTWANRYAFWIWLNRMIHLSGLQVKMSKTQMVTLVLNFPAYVQAKAL